MNNDDFREGSRDKLVREMMEEWDRMDRTVPSTGNMPKESWEQNVRTVWIWRKRKNRRETLLFLLIALFILCSLGISVFQNPYLFAFIQGGGLAVAAVVIVSARFVRKEKRHEV